MPNDSGKQQKLQILIEPVHGRYWKIQQHQKNTRLAQILKKNPLISRDFICSQSLQGKQGDLTKITYPPHPKKKKKKICVWVAYIKRQLGIATQVAVIKVNDTVARNRNSVSAQ